MPRTLPRLIVPVVSLLLSLASGCANQHMAVGAMAPDFLLQGSDGRAVSLSEFRGQRRVVLAFFPKAFTGG